MTTRTAVCLLLPIAALLAWACPAFAAGSGTEEAAAEVLFQDAKKLLAAGDAAGACPKFAESQRLSPSSGALLSLGACYEQLGRLASSWGIFKQAEVSARNAGDAGRQSEAARRAALLTPRLSKLAIVVPPLAKVPGFVLKRDGDVVGEGQWGSLMPVDSGQHSVEASAPGYKPWSTTVRIETEGAATSVEVGILDKLPAEGTSAPGVSPSASTWGPQRIAGVGVGAAGVVGGVVGAILGAATLQKISASKSEGHCNASLTLCDATGLQMQQAAMGTAHGSTASLVIGSAALVTGIVLFATGAPGEAEAPKKSGARVTLGPVAGAGVAGVLLHGEW